MSQQTSPLIAIADDEPAILQLMRHHLRAWGYRVATAEDTEALAHLLAKEVPSTLLLDLCFGEANGLDVLDQVVRQHPGLPVILFTGNGSIDTAVQGIKRGAFDYAQKPSGGDGPPDFEPLKRVIAHAVRIRELELLAAEMNSASRLWGESLAMRQVQTLVRSVAPVDATVLITGESGTGKEIVARKLHDRSPRAKGPFVPVNMAALPRELIESTLFGHEKGAFTGAVQTQAGCCEAADKGTLFLDEIGEMDLSLQAKLLRFLQERTIQRVGSAKSRQVDVRVVAATNRDLLERCRQGQFREDLYYRLNVVPVHLPPLRERLGDVPLLAARFLRRFAIKYHKPITGFTPEAMAALEAFDWPGNVRQLENLCERLAILGTTPLIGAPLLPPEISPRTAAPFVLPQSPSPGPSTAPQPAPETGPRTMDEIERRAICEALGKARGNVREAARILGLGQATVYRKIKRYNIVAGEPAPVTYAPAPAMTAAPG